MAPKYIFRIILLISLATVVSYTQPLEKPNSDTLKVPKDLIESGIIKLKPVSQEINYNNYLTHKISRGTKSPDKPNSSFYLPVESISNDSVKQTWTFNSRSSRKTLLEEKWINNSWVNSKLSTYTYDNNGNRIAGQSANWINKEWVEFEWFFSTYNNYNQKLSSLSKFFAENGDLYLIRNEFTYDNMGNTLTEFYEIRINDIINSSSRVIKTFNNNSQKLSTITQSLINNVWANSGRSSYVYNSTGNCIGEIYETWENNGWVIISQIANTYDISGNLISFVLEDRDINYAQFMYRSTGTYSNNNHTLTIIKERKLNGCWENENRETQNYDDKGNTVCELSEYWGNNSWNNTNKHTSIYDINGNCITYLSELWMNNVWVCDSRSFSTYDIHGNRIASLDQTRINDTLVNSYLYSYTYDNNGNATYGNYYTWENNAWRECNTGLAMDFNHGKNVLILWAHKAYVKYTYMGQMIENNQDTFVLEQNYPNPFNPVTTINYYLASSAFVTLKVYDILGKEIITLVNKDQPAGYYKKEFKGTGFASGVYFYKLTAENFTEIKKMMLLR